MCGIAGYYNLSVSQDQVNGLINKLRHRGPDDQRFYSRGDTGLIHTRLSIIDLSDLGAQPYRFESLVIVFNGELYNYKEVRADLKKLGYTFQSNSDTEVLIKAFHCWKEQCISHFVGMFAFAVYDEAADAMWLFRDRLGVKPLYYSSDNGRLIFASELSALSVLNHDCTIDPDSLYFYFRFGFIPGHRSIYKSVSKLEAGHYLRIDRAGVTVEKYWNPSYEIDHTKTENQWTDELEYVMISSFRYRMVSDVPVGVFLSGGIDSSLLAAVLKKHYGPIHSFTIGFQEPEFDESGYAKKVAAHLGIIHTEKVLQLAEAKKILGEFYSMYDEPFADTSGIPTSCVTRLAKDHGMKVVLSADGGDEIFGGYTHYQRAQRLHRSVFNLSTGIRNALRASMRAFFPDSVRARISAFNSEHKAYALEEILATDDPVHLFEAMLANQAPDEIEKLINYSGSYLSSASANAEPLQQMMIWDLNNFLTDDLLVKVDRATMYHGIECREPLLDHRLVELAMRMPMQFKIRDGKGKYIERQLLKRYVPAEFFERPKRGFSIPVFAWFSQELDAMFKTHLSEDNLRSVSFLNYGEVQKEYNKYLQYKKRGKHYNIEKMWRILSFVLWWEKHNSNGG